MRGANPGRCAEPWIKSCRECGKASRAATAPALLVARAYLSLNTPPVHSSAPLFIPFLFFFFLHFWSVKDIESSDILANFLKKEKHHMDPFGEQSQHFNNNQKKEVPAVFIKLKMLQFEARTIEVSQCGKIWK